MRYQVEFCRLATKIHNLWRARKVPLCEQVYVSKVLKRLIAYAKSEDNSEALIDQMEDYYSFLSEFFKLEDKLKGLISSRNQVYEKLVAVSQTFKDLKLFEAKGPKLM